MDAESCYNLIAIDSSVHWYYRARHNPCRLKVETVWWKKTEIANLIRLFSIRTQCGRVSVQVPGILDFKAGIPDFADPFRVTRQLECVLPELPGGLASIIERYADVWIIRYTQFCALMDKAFHASNVTGRSSQIDRYLGLTMLEVDECLCFSFIYNEKWN